MDKNFHDRCGDLLGRSGQILVEAIVALGILMLGLMGILALLTRSLGASKLVSDTYIATYLAEEGIEIARSFFDHNVLSGHVWNEGFTNNGPSGTGVDYLMGTALNIGTAGNFGFDPKYNSYRYAPTCAAGATDCQGVNQIKFTRAVIVLLIGSDEIQINSVVAWKAGGLGLAGPLNQEVNLEAHFFKP